MNKPKMEEYGSDQTPDLSFTDLRERNAGLQLTGSDIERLVRLQVFAPVGEEENGGRDEKEKKTERTDAVGTGGSNQISTSAHAARMGIILAPLLVLERAGLSFLALEPRVGRV